FTHAADVAEALRILLAKNLRDDDFNICGNNTLRMDELARRIWGRVNRAIPFPGFKNMPVPPADVRFRVGVSEKAKKLLGWSPRHELDYIIDDSLGFIRAKMPAGGAR